MLVINLKVPDPLRGVKQSVNICLKRACMNASFYSCSFMVLFNLAKLKNIQMEFGTRTDSRELYLKVTIEYLYSCNKCWTIDLLYLNCMHIHWDEAGRTNPLKTYNSIVS